MKITNENSAHDDNIYKMIDESIDGLECSLDVYKKKNSSNIMVICQTRVAKSTLIHSLLNHLEGIEIDEKIR